MRSMSQPLSLTVITAIGPHANTEFFTDTARSVSTAYTAAKEKMRSVSISWVIAGGKDSNIHADIADIVRTECAHVFDNVHLLTPGGEVEDNSVGLMDVGNVYCAASIARNMAASACNSDNTVLINCDADDLMLPTRLIRAYEDFIYYSYPDFLIYPAFDIVEKDGTWHTEEKLSAYNCTHVLKHGWFNDHVANSALDVHMASLCITKQAFDKVGGYPGLPFVEDTVLAHTLSTRADMSGLASTVPTWIYRKHDNSLSHSGYNASAVLARLISDFPAPQGDKGKADNPQVS